MSTLRIVFLLSLVIFSSNYTMEDNFKHVLQGFEEKKIGKDYLINLMESLRKKKYHPITENYVKNEKAFTEHSKKIKFIGFIEYQQNYKDMFYGIKPLSYNGASLIAIYNVLYHLNKAEKKDFLKIIKSFENDGIILEGKFGTSIKAVEDYIKKKGLRTENSRNKNNYEDIGSKADASIFIFYKKDDGLKPIHFVAITKNTEKFNVHNYKGISHQKAFDSMKDVLEAFYSEKISDISLIGIYKNE